MALGLRTGVTGQQRRVSTRFVTRVQQQLAVSRARDAEYRRGCGAPTDSIQDRVREHGVVVRPRRAVARGPDAAGQP